MTWLESNTELIGVGVAEEAGDRYQQIIEQSLRSGPAGHG